MATLSLKIENMPDVSFPVLIVNTAYPNSATSDVVDDITKPLERELAQVSDVKAIESFSSDNSSSLMLYLEAGVDLQEKRDEVERLAGNVSLPSTANRPKVTIQGFSNQPVYYLFVSPKNPLADVDKFNYDLNETIIKDIKEIEGIEKVSTVGGETKQVKILPKMDEMQYYGISPLQLKQQLIDNHVAVPVGILSENGEEQIVRVVSRYTDLEKIKDTKIFLQGESGSGLSYIRLGDLAEIQFDHEANSISRFNERTGVTINIYKTKEANSVETGDLINEKIAELQKQYPDLQFDTIYDTSIDIKSSINGMVKEGLLGAVMASLIIWLFLRHLSATLIVLISIPMSILVSLIFMSWMDITLNIITLFGMAVAVGRVVDDSIVVIENIFRHLQLNQERKEGTILAATSEMIHAITSSTLTTIAVFLPIIFVGGMIGEIFQPFALTVVCSLIASLIVAVTIVPLMAKLTILKNKTIKEYEPGKITLLYKRVLEWSLQRKPVAALLAFVLFIGSMILIPYVKTGMLPDSQVKYIFAQLEMPTGTPLTTMNDTVTRMEQELGKEAGVEYIQSNIGSENQADIKYTNQSMTLIRLHNDVDVDATLKKFEESLKPLMPLGTKLTLSKPSSSSNNQFTVVLYASDFDKLEQASETIKDKLKQSPLLANVRDNVNDIKNQVLVQVDRDKAAEWGITPVQIAAEVNLLVSDMRIGKINMGEQDYDLLYGISGDKSHSLEELHNIYIQTPSGQAVRLTDLAVIDQEKVQAQVMRKDEQQFIKITADITSDNKGGASSFVFATLQAVELPDGVTLSTEGVSSDIQESFQDMMLAIAAAIFIVYLVMLITFGNATSPLAILLSLPLAAIGGIVAIFVTDSVLDVTALIGFLMLVGIVVTNAIVYVDNIQQRRSEGAEMREAVIQAGITRLRPIMMTAIATVGALIPLSLGLSGGSLMTKSLAVVVIGGITTSTLLTLIIVPVGYELLYKIKKEFFTSDHEQETEQVGEDGFIDVLKSLRENKKSV